jgi:hypothetical protein
VALVKPHLLRLMTRVKADHLRYGPEDSEAKRFADRLRIWTMEGMVRGVWNHIANEIAGESGGHADEKVRNSLRRKAEIRYAKAQALGMIIGWSDYVFCRSDRSLALECKSARGGQRPGQEDFQRWCEDQGIPYLIFRTAEEGWGILVEHGFLDPAAWNPDAAAAAGRGT